MTMITSSLQSNNLFDHSSLSLRPLGSRPTSGKPHGLNELGHPATGFGHNIWQSNWQTSHEKSAGHMLKDNVTSSRAQDIKLNSVTANKRPQPPSLALPDIKPNTQLFGNAYDRKSPIGSEREAARESEPLSARSRSQFETSSLTPTSFSNDSELSTQHTTSSLDQRRWRDPFSSGPGRELTRTWLDAPEFQPSLTIPQQDMLRHQVREPYTNAFVDAAKSQMLDGFDHEIVDNWASLERNGSVSERNEFRPVLSANAGVVRHGSLGISGVTSNRHLYDHDIALTRSSVSRNPRLSGLTRSEIQPVPTTKTQVSSTRAQNGQHVPLSISNAWSRRPPVYQQSMQGTDSRHGEQNNINSAFADLDNSLQYNSATSQNLQPSYLSNQLQQPHVRYSHQFDGFRPADADFYTPHMYHANLYGQDTKSISASDHRPASYNIDPAAVANPSQLSSTTACIQTGASQTVRSPLLAEFRLHGRTKKYELRDIFGHIVEFSGDQLGSRFIQHKLEVANSEEKERVFQEIASDCRQLMTDLFGNYVIQKLFEHGDQSQKKVLASHMRGHMMALSTQTYGCRVVQKALEHILTDQQASLIKELDGQVLKVIDDQNGNHVIQKAIECIPGEHIQFIVDAHRGHVHSLSRHAYGCRVIQRMLEHCQPQAKRVILDELHSNIGDLIQDPFGNYVVQHVIVNGEPQDRRPVIDKVQSRLLENAMHKFASNVVEKALDYAEEDQRQMMLQTMTSRDDHGQSQVIKLLSHQYGNYVIQKGAGYLNGQALGDLLEEMEQYLMQLRRVSTGKQTTALETSIQSARTRFNAQRHHMMLRVPTEPSRYSPVRRQGV